MSKITVRPIQDDDLVEISEWFAARKWKSPPRGNILPETGYVAVKGDAPVAVAWLYVTNSSIGIVDWIATSPTAGISGLIGISKVLKYIEKISSDSVSTYMHFTPNDKLAKWLKKKCNYKTAETGVNLCIRTVPPRGVVANG